MSGALDLIYGNPWQTDGVNNQQIGGTGPWTFAIRDRSLHTGLLTAIVVYRKADDASGLSSYWNGTGGSNVLRVETDSGGFPTGTLIAAGATVSKTIAAPSAVVADRYTLGTPFVDVEGMMRHFVFASGDGAPSTNFTSINCLYRALSPTPVETSYADADRACVRKAGAGAYAIDRSRFPLFCLEYADGTRIGVNYVDALRQSGAREIGGTSSLGKVRANFTPTLTRVVRSPTIYAYQAGGATQPLQVNLRNLSAAGALVAQALIPAASIPTGNRPAPFGAGNGEGAVPLKVAFANDPNQLVAGTNYALELASAETANPYYSFPSREGGEPSTAVDLFLGDDRWLDGAVFEYTTDGGSNWLKHSVSPDEQQLQVFFELVPTIGARRFASALTWSRGR